MDHDKELLIKKLIHQTFQEQLEKIKKNKNDQSYLFLDSDTLNLILTILLLKYDSNLLGVDVKDDDLDEVNILNEKLSDLAEKQKLSFEELINQLS